MPTEPPHSTWEFPDLSSADSAGCGDLVGHGADLLPGTLLHAYRSGLFPMPAEEPRAGLSWWSPDPRGILRLDGLRVTRSLRKSARRYELRIDTAFEQVVAACAAPSRDGCWIDESIATAYTTLHRLGWAHSIETWREGELVGGLYGVAIGGLFAGESMFHRATDASKVALMGLVDLLSDAHADARLLDVQWCTNHLASLGVVEVPRATYLSLLRRALSLPLPLGFARG